MEHSMMNRAGDVIRFKFAMWSLRATSGSV
jgi:hypothetical protein